MKEKFMDKIIVYTKLIRVKQWIKNILIFLPGFFAGVFFDKDVLIVEIMAFLTFSFGTSVVYIINDIQDVEKDRLHTTKKNRPIASGKISIRKAYIVNVVLLSVCVLLNLYCFGGNYKVVLVQIIYMAINFWYSIGHAKNIPLLDVVILVSGFVLRLIYGALMVDVQISAWLYLVIIAGAFYMGFGKRRNELMKNSTETRKVLKHYSKDFLDKNMYCCMTLIVTFYSLWCLDKGEGILSSNYLLSIPLLMIILFKYSMDVEGNSDGDPTTVILGDKVLIALCGVMGLLLLFSIY